MISDGESPGKLQTVENMFACETVKTILKHFSLRIWDLIRCSLLILFTFYELAPGFMQVIYRFIALRLPTSYQHYQSLNLNTGQLLPPFYVLFSVQNQNWWAHKFNLNINNGY